MFLALHIAEGFAPAGDETPSSLRARRNKAAAAALTVADSDHVLGDRGADVVLLQYGDYTCPDTARVHEALERLVERFAGRLALVYRHCPAPHRGTLADLAAEAAEAAAAEGQFWAMHRRLLAESAIPDAAFLSWHAAAVGLNLRQFGQAMSHRNYAPVVSGHLESAKRLGVRQTPHFFINGQPHTGPADGKSIRSALEGALSGNQ